MLFIILVMCGMASASDLQLVDVNQVLVDYRNYKMLNPNNRNLLLYPEPAKEGLTLSMQSSVLRYGYLNTDVEALTTDEQYRSVGLKLEVGLRLTPQVELGLMHHSQHQLDKSPTYQGAFPVEDAVQIKLYFYRKYEHNNSLLGGK